MYELFLDAVSTRGKMLLLRDGKSIGEEVIELAGNESSKLGAKVFSFLEGCKVDVSELGRIHVVRGPGSFTGIRSICLFCNTLAFIYPSLELYPLSFFDLFEKYPIIKQSSRRDVFVKMQKNATIEIVPISELHTLLAGNSEVWGSFDISCLEREDILLSESYNTHEVISRCSGEVFRYIEPLYIKTPNIH